MTRRDFPEQVLRNSILVRGINLLENHAARNALVLSVEEFLVPNHATVRMNRSRRHTDLQCHDRPRGNRQFLRQRKAVAIQVAGETSPHHMAAAIRVIAKQYRNVEPVRKTVRGAQLLCRTARAITGISKIR